MRERSMVTASGDKGIPVEEATARSNRQEVEHRIPLMSLLDFFLRVPSREWYRPRLDFSEAASISDDHDDERARHGGRPAETLGLGLVALGGLCLRRLGGLRGER